MKLSEVEQLAKEKMAKYLSPEWTFAWTVNIGSIGLCKYSTKQIVLSKSWMEAMERGEVFDTILHEIAHALVGPGNGHNKVWKTMARSIGAKPKSSVSLSYETTERARCNKSAFLKGRQPGETVVKYAPKPPKYVIIDPAGEIVKRYYKKPSEKIFARVPYMYLSGDRTATYGKLKLVPFQG
jgi:predicted SprT family Zn-dependent metalloprotease